jgi:hypothetical protein
MVLSSTHKITSNAEAMQCITQNDQNKPGQAVADPSTPAEFHHEDEDPVKVFSIFGLYTDLGCSFFKSLPSDTPLDAYKAAFP